MRTRKTSPQSCAVLDALRAQPAEWRHGYDLARLTGLSSGTLYPILIRLHERGLLEAKWVEPERPGGPARHAYRLSGLGPGWVQTVHWAALVVPALAAAWAGRALGRLFPAGAVPDR